MDMEQAITESHSSVTTQAKSQSNQLPLGDVNEYGDDDDDEEDETAIAPASKEVVLYHLWWGCQAMVHGSNLTYLCICSGPLVCGTFCERKSKYLYIYT